MIHPWPRDTLISANLFALMDETRMPRNPWAAMLRRMRRGQDQHFVFCEKLLLQEVL